MEKENKIDRNIAVSAETVVSVIMPAYNVERYIREALESVYKQTYEKWECIVVNDASEDHTGEIIQEYCLKDSRFQCIELEKNRGAAIARNKAITEAKGKYLAFLDGDDIWAADKLEKQIQFMEDNQYDFTCTCYGKIDENGRMLNRVVKVKPQYDYSEILKNCPGNSTVIYNCHKLGKMYAEDIKRRNDFVMWLKVIKKAVTAYGLSDLLTYHRERTDSISFKKIALIRYQWVVYRNIEQLSVIRCIYLVGYKMANGLAIKLGAVLKNI